jgi:gamma-glutamylcyclotransferase (GGCT)/AIG2-like uncharacterized protein YtfP
MTTRELFVYGTLMRDERNHRLLVEAEFLGEARTVAGFTMIDLGAFPGVVAMGAGAIVGEVFRVNAQTLAAVDRLEGHPSFYRRTEIELEGGGRAEAYLMPKRELRGNARLEGGSGRDRQATRAAAQTR